MYTINYDGSFHGFLTVVFDHFSIPELPAFILTFDREQHKLFPSDTFIETNRKKALRVWKGIERKNTAAAKAIYFAFLSEQTDIELLLFRYIRSLFHGHSENQALTKREKDRVYVLADQVAKEKQRVEIFTRFEVNAHGLLEAHVQPKHNVLPLLSKHFKALYHGASWLIVDTKRQQALSCDGMSLELQAVLAIQGMDGARTLHPYRALRKKSKVAV